MAFDILKHLEDAGKTFTAADMRRGDLQGTSGSTVVFGLADRDDKMSILTCQIGDKPSMAALLNTLIDDGQLTIEQAEKLATQKKAAPPKDAYSTLTFVGKGNAAGPSSSDIIYSVQDDKGDTYSVAHPLSEGVPQPGWTLQRKVYGQTGWAACSKNQKQEDTHDTLLVLQKGYTVTGAIPVSADGFRANRTLTSGAAQKAVESAASVG
jgi:hypothetical protein